MNWNDEFKPFLMNWNELCEFKPFLLSETNYMNLDHFLQILHQFNLIMWSITIFWKFKTNL
jgi:hypothetical protein